MPRVRDYGEGTVRRRKDGLFEGRLPDGSVDGRRQQRYVYAKTKRLVQVKLKEARRDRDAGLDSGQRQTVQDFLAHWLEQTVKGRVRPRVYIDYAGIVHNHLTPALGRYTLQELARNPEILQRLLNQKRETLSVSRVYQIRVILHSAMKQAALWRRVPWNVADLVTASQPTPGPKPTFDAEQVLRLLEAVSEDRLYALYVLALTTGMRQSEAFGLRWEYVDLEARRLTVEAGVHRAQGKVWFSDPKSKKGRRPIPLTDIAVEALRAHRAHQRPARKPWAGLVFTTTAGTPLHGANLLERSYYPALQRAGLPPIPFRNLRHSCATLLLALGVDLRTIQEILGHSRFSTTADHYLQAMPPMMRDASDRLDRLLTTTALPPLSS